MAQFNLTVERIDASSNAVITNLLEHYCHDMSEWLHFDTREDGRYAYDMSRHWQRGDTVYLARCSGKLAGFAMITSAKPWLPDADGYDMEEFFVLRHYRRRGTGEALARTVWGLHPGRWLVRVYEGNLPAVPFWRRIISRQTHDTHTEEPRVVNGKPWVFFHFTAGIAPPPL